MVPQELPSERGLLHLPDALSARIRASGDNWPTVLSTQDAVGFDFGWMHQALAYSYWNIGAAGPIAEQGRQIDLGVVVPDYRLFFQWSKLRYTEAMAQGDVSQAQVEVQHLVVLIGSSGGMIAQNAAIFLLRIEGQAVQAASQRGIPTESFTPVSTADLDELQRLGESGLAYFWPGVSVSVMKQALSCIPLPCAGLVEGAFMRNTVGSLSTNDTDRDFWPLADASRCDSNLLETIRSAVPPTDATRLFLKMWPQSAALPLDKLFGLPPDSMPPQ